LDEEERDSFDDVEYYEREQERQMLVVLQKKLEANNHSVLPQTPNDVDKGMIGLPVTEKVGVHENLFACYYEPVERMPTPGLTLSSKSSVTGFSLASPALVA
jgi:hypothetical protein